MSHQVPLGLLVLVDPRFHASSSTRVHFQTPLSYAMCLLSAGYFFHDLVMCAWRINLEGPLYLMHGFACHCAFAFGLHTGFIHYHGAAFLQWEISTPFVHTRYARAGLQVGSWDGSAMHRWGCAARRALRDRTSHVQVCHVRRDVHEGHDA